MYIIDELIKIIELFKKNNNIDKINKIKNNMRENADIIQQYGNTNFFLFGEKLITNFESLYDLIIKDEIINKSNTDYFDKLRYIFFKEIMKISDINYQYKVFEKIMENDEIIKKSNDIFQILLKNKIKKEKFIDSRNNLLNANDKIVKLIEKKLNEQNKTLAETLLYFFEKNSLIYLNYILNDKDVKMNLEDEGYKGKKEKNGPLQIFKDCIEYLNCYLSSPDKFKEKSKEICKLFCLGYIRVYCYSFIKILNDNDQLKMLNHKIIFDIINGKDSIYKMIRLFIYKILYYNYTISVFIHQDNYEKYKLNEYIDLSEYLKNNDFIDIYKIDYKIKTLNNDFYDKTHKTFEKFKNDEFKKKIKEKDLNIEDIGIDNFYAVSYNLTLANLQMENSSINTDFYHNICIPLFKNSNLLYKGIQLLYEPKKFKDIKKNFNINPNNIKALLSGYRFCLNELFSHNSRGIYYPLYEGKTDFLSEKLFPGNDTKPNKIYYNIMNHFKKRPKEGCFVCLCEKGGYYHSVPSGFPGIKELKKKCPRCKEEIGSYEKGIFQKDIIIVKREKYYRIFKDKKEIEELKSNNVKKAKLKEINSMTLDQYKKQFIEKSLKTEKGVLMTTSIDFKSDEKVVRNLSPISYRLLNYILYSHLFFARIITEKTVFNNYLPRRMSWIDTLSECWKLLNKELLKENIDSDSVEKFINYSFIDLFPLLNKEKYIENYDELIKFEDKLDSKIQDIIKKFKDENDKKKLKKQKNDEDITSFINLLKEKFTSDYYESEEFPFYDYFYYSDYLNDIYINEKLKLVDENKYPLLKYYLEESINDKKVKDKYSLDNLNTFNTALNLINEKYFKNISRKNAEKRLLKDDPLYINNKGLIDSFIKFYNSLEFKNDNNENIQLSINNNLKSFFIDNDDNIGSTYITIYQNFIKNQNKNLENLLDIKIERGLFDDNCKKKINIQNINENEIFTLKLPEKETFTEILFNSSYRKIQDSDSRNFELYKEYEINYDLIEENLTELLLKNKKLLEQNFNQFIYNDESFDNQVSNLVTLFNKKYNVVKMIGLNDKAAIYKFYEPNKSNKNVCKNVINDFITLINFLNGKRKENDNNQYTEQTKLFDVVLDLKETVSDYLIKIFEGNESLTINKTSAIFDYYLKLVYELIIKEINNYQEKLDVNTVNLINNYYKEDHLIGKNELAYAIRIFMTLVLMPEEEKETKIKLNDNNVINYLRAPDLWKNVNMDDDFNKNLNEIKKFNVKISQIKSFYEVLGKDIEDNFINDVKGMLNNKNDDNKSVDVNLAENKKDINRNIENKKEDEKIVAKAEAGGDEEEEEDEDDPFAKKKDSDSESDS